MLEDVETDKALVELIQRHINPATEYFHKTTCLERKKVLHVEKAHLKEEFERITKYATLKES
jgi:hypothetical protein